MESCGIPPCATWAATGPSAPPADCSASPRGLRHRSPGPPGGGLGVGEIRHVRVHPDARPPGLARRLLDSLEHAAAERHLTVVRLDTHTVLTEARAMHLACGCAEIPRYDDNPYAGHWFEKRLSPAEPETGPRPAEA
ncbi:GNAT family N-acetyltransferase [Streptomyces sp. NPDC047042]|uniref:GNAT family N-acetyltransferase n=1 Tax=Streptomyces sp. NPDC047042 TaxID=3154807 RepID=UPI0033E6F483